MTSAASSRLFFGETSAEAGQPGVPSVAIAGFQETVAA